MMRAFWEGAGLRRNSESGCREEREREGNGKGKVLAVSTKWDLLLLSVPSALFVCSLSPLQLL